MEKRGNNWITIIEQISTKINPLLILIFFLFLRPDISTLFLLSPLRITDDELRFLLVSILIIIIMIEDCVLSSVYRYLHASIIYLVLSSSITGQTRSVKETFGHEMFSNHFSRVSYNRSKIHNFTSNSLVRRYTSIQKIKNYTFFNCYFQCPDFALFVIPFSSLNKCKIKKKKQLLENLVLESF